MAVPEETHVEAVEPPGSRLLTRVAGLDRWWVLVVGALLLIFLLVQTQPDPYRTMFVFLEDGIVVTLKITLTSFVLILVVGLIGGLGRLSRNPILKGIASLYVEVVRGVPLLVQLLFIWFALPQVFAKVGESLARVWPAGGAAISNISLEPFSAAVLGITLCYGAYMSEVFRAGIQSIHRGQMEAARSLGMTYFQAMRFVILPQAIRVILPPVGNEYVTLLKDSSLVSVLAVSDLTRRGREYMARTFQSFETWTMVALIYLVLTLTSARIAGAIERRMSKGR
jgi:polar amino acid transport system permease protein